MATLVPIFTCVVLPIAIVLIISLTNVNKDNKQAQVLIKAIETNNNIDIDKFAEAMSKPKRNAKELLNLRLVRGCIFTLIGIAVGCYSLFNSHIRTNEDLQITIGMASVVSIAIGISYLTVYFVTRKQIND